MSPEAVPLAAELGDGSEVPNIGKGQTRMALRYCASLLSLMV